MEETASAATLDARTLRNVLGSFPTGVTVITTVDAAGRCIGVTANSFSSVSLDPPLILWNQSLASASYPAFRDAQRFVVNILAEDQVDVSRRFATPGIDRFEGVRTRFGLGGVPLIEGCVAHLECIRETSFPGGDHAVFIGRIEKTYRAQRRPLAFGGGGYLRVRPHPQRALRERLRRSLSMGIEVIKRRLGC